MIKFGPNRHNSDKGGFDPPFNRMQNSRFAIPPQIDEMQSETINPIKNVLDTSNQQKYINGLIHDMQHYITIIEQHGDRGKAQKLRERMTELQSLPLNNDTVRSYEELHQHIVYSSQSFDE